MLAANVCAADFIHAQALVAVPRARGPDAREARMLLQAYLSAWVWAQRQR